MREILGSRIGNLIVWYLVTAFAGVFTVPAVAKAAFIPNAGRYVDGNADGIDQLKQVLENELLRGKLSGLGLSQEEIAGRIDSLTAQERRAVLADLDRIQAGGDGLGTVLTVALIVLVVVLILKLLDKEIVIK
ncbi:MAG: PA2779 family protein [bacterium]|nr:MAG: PA2779 family protein [bacterium]